MHSEELTLISCTKNSAGKFFITGGGIDVSVTFISFEMIRDLLYLYSEIPQERIFHHHLRGANVYEANAKGTNRFSHTYFQNCMREWNQSDESIKSSPTISVFKRELMSLIRPKIRSSRSRVEFSDLREHRFRHNFQCSGPMCFCQTGIENNEHFLLHCLSHSSDRRYLLDRISNVVDVDPENLSSTDLCNLLLYGNSCFSADTNHHVIESTISFIKSTSRFKRI